jgi:transposase
LLLLETKERAISIRAESSSYHLIELVMNEEKALNITAYSPNLNPIERLWKAMNENVRNNAYFHLERQFISAIQEFFGVVIPEIFGPQASRSMDDFQLLRPASLS